MSSTPLRLTAFEGHLDVAKYLVAKGADVNEKATDGTPPLIDSDYARGRIVP